MTCSKHINERIFFTARQLPYQCKSIFTLSTRLSNISGLLRGLNSRNITSEQTLFSKMSISLKSASTETKNCNAFNKKPVSRVISRGPVTKPNRNSVAATIVVTSPTGSRASIINMAVKKLRQQVKFSFTVDNKSTKVISRGGNLYAVVLNYSKKFSAELKNWLLTCGLIQLGFAYFLIS